MEQSENVNKPSDAHPELNCVVGWQPIETAPEDVLVVVGWLDKEYCEYPERHDFDIKENGVWQVYDGLSQHAQAAAPRDIPCKMPSDEAPYICWMYLPPIPGVPNVGAQARAEAGEARCSESPGA